MARAGFRYTSPSSAHARRSTGWRRTIRAFLRDTRLLIRQFRWSLSAFVGLIVVSATCLRFLYVAPGSTEAGLSWARAFHATLNMVFLEHTLDFPDRPLAVQVLFFVVPLLGVAVLADSVVRFGVALFNRYERKEAWQVALASTYRDHVIVCGLGRLGYRVVRQLLDLGEEVVGVEVDPINPFLPEIQALRVPVLVADARQPETLLRANVQVASAIAICTQDDLANLDVALDARELNPGIKVVMRMFDSRLAERVQRGFAIHTAFSTSALAAPLFAAAATRTQVDCCFDVDGTMMSVTRVTVAPGSLLDGRTVGQIEHEYGLAVTMHRHGGETSLHPPESTHLQPGDALVLVGPLHGLTRLRGIPPSGRRQRSRNRPDAPDRATEGQP
jgi:voltage-gated potassium channel